MDLRLGFTLIVSVLLCACAVPPRSPGPPPDLRSPFTGYRSARYDDPRWWLCMPGRADACAGNLDATEIRPDGSHVEVRDTQLPGSEQVDCFWVYPTVDLRPWPASHEDFSDLTRQTLTTAMQVARFRSVCRVFAPLYRQTTFGAYIAGKRARAPYREVAVSDVVDAFLAYMGQYNQGRKVVLIGHSQGGEMVIELLKRFFDHDAAMRDRLLLAMPIGWQLEVAPGKTTGGTFDNLPVCSKPGETGCVVAFRSYDAYEHADPGRANPSDGRESVCVEPSVLAHGTTTMARSLFMVPGWYGVPTWLYGLSGVGSVQTPFVMVRGLYEGKCVSGDYGFRYLAVRKRSRQERDAGDVRVSPLDLSTWWLHGELGFHVFDMQFEAGDLMDLVGERVRALGARAAAP